MDQLISCTSFICVRFCSEWNIVGYTTGAFWELWNYSDFIISMMASQIASLTIVYATFYSGADQRKYQSSASLAFVWGIHRWPGNSPHKWPVTRKMFPFNDVIIVFTLKNTGNIDGYLSTTKHNKTCTVCLSLGIHDMPLPYTAGHPVKQYWVDALSRVSMFW